MGFSKDLLNNNVSAKGQLEESLYVSFFGDGGKKVLFVGNSITRHRPLATIGWHGDWGMSASSLEKDYVHLVADELKKRYGNVQCCIAGAAVWEQNYDDPEILPKHYQNAREFQADVVIVRIGENINRDKIKEIPLKKHFDQMISFFASNPKAKVFVSDLFWRSESIDDVIHEVVNENGYTFVEIGDLGEDPAMKAIGLFEHRGVQLHPGDLGMRKIADRFLEKL